MSSINDLGKIPDKLLKKKKKSTVQEILDKWSVSEKATVTKGMKNALSKLKPSGLMCKSCGFRVPAYQGRYPAKCPECGGSILPISGE